MEELYYVSKEGLEKLHQKEKQLQEKLLYILSQKDDAFRNCGDMWHDNPTLMLLENEERSVRKRINEAKEKIKKVKVLKEKGKGSHLVEIGSKVEIIFNEKSKMILTILDPELVNPEEGIISYESPIAKAILGARKGELKSYEVNKKKMTARIVKIFE